MYKRQAVNRHTSQGVACPSQAAMGSRSSSVPNKMIPPKPKTMYRVGFSFFCARIYTHNGSFFPVDTSLWRALWPPGGAERLSLIHIFADGNLCRSDCLCQILLLFSTAFSQLLHSYAKNVLMKHGLPTWQNISFSIIIFLSAF